MKWITQLGKSAFLTFSMMVFVFIAAITQIAQASDPVPFAGKVNLCAVDFSKSWVETKGKGQQIHRNLVYVSHLETDSPLLSGWEVLTVDVTYKKDGSQYSDGQTYMVPDNIAVGAFFEEFSILVTDVLTGTYHGVGSLTGVTVDYTIPINWDDPDYCYDHPYCDDPGTACEYLHEMVDQEPFGYYIYGTIYGLDELAEEE